MSEHYSMTAVLVTTYNRPSALIRSLPQIMALGRPVLVVDDGSTADAVIENESIIRENHARYLHLPSNRGLAAAMNIGLSYWLADKTVEWISCFQDDVDVRPDLLKQLQAAIDDCPGDLYTGHDSGDHPTAEIHGELKIKRTCAGLHLHARRDFWASIMPIPTYQLGAPKRVAGRERGIGSNVDWWIVRDSPHSVQRRGNRIVCLPGLVRTFLHKPEHSSWGNAPRCGEDPPLRAAS